MTAAEWGRGFAAASPDVRRLVRSVAYHEAGHAVAMVLAGAGVERVWLSPRLLTSSARGEELGHVVPRIFHRLTDLCYASGPVAQMEAGFEAWAESDRAGLRARLRVGSRYETKAIEDAREEIRECWPAVQDVAAALVDLRELDGDEAERIILARIPEWRRAMIPA